MFGNQGSTMSARSKRNPKILGWEIQAALAFKIAGLMALYLLFFTPAHRVTVTGQELTSHLFAAAAPLTNSQKGGDR